MTITIDRWVGHSILDGTEHESSHWEIRVDGMTAGITAGSGFGITCCAILTPEEIEAMRHAFNEKFGVPPKSIFVYPELPNEFWQIDEDEDEDE